MRTRRRAKYTWFPNIGFQGSDEENDLAGFPFSVGVSATAGTITSSVTELIPDFVHSQPSTSGDSLNEFIGNEYVLKRLVGKVFMSVNAQIGGPLTIIVAAGFFVARAEEAAPQLPIGTGTAADINLNYGPLNNQNIREPWLWRRAWQLRNPGESTSRGLDGTYSGGSVLDGPHIDAKSARRIRQDERLFFSFAATHLDAFSAAQSTAITGYLDYRVLGALRKAKSRSAF